jgi:MOSC domain-containing protein YiiM
MIFKWPFFRRKFTAPARLTGIYIATSAGKAMHAVNSINAIEGKGLEGDRYYLQTGFWKSIEACQVTLISEDEINRAQQNNSDLHNQLENGAHRRNLVIQGLKTNSLEHKHFRIGTAVFSYHKPRPPCGYLDKIEGQGMSRAIARNSGACIRILESGTISVGDTLIILDRT